MSVFPVIAIDGPSASGKGTIGQRLADAFGFDHLDTGLHYRAVGCLVLDAGGDPAREDDALAAAARFRPGLIPEERLKDDRVSRASSQIAVHAEVRKKLQAFQRAFAAHPPGGRGAVLDGRDIGTVICPDAACKIYIVARVEERARRRFLQLKSLGFPADEAQILADLRERDRRDSERATDPLKPAPDAHLLDTSDLTIEAAVAAALDLARQALAHR